MYRIANCRCRRCRCRSCRRKAWKIHFKICGVLMLLFPSTSSVCIVYCERNNGEQIWRRLFRQAFSNSFSHIQPRRHTRLPFYSHFHMNQSTDKLIKSTRFRVWKQEKKRKLLPKKLNRGFSSMKFNYSSNESVVENMKCSRCAVVKCRD